MQQEINKLNDGRSDLAKQVNALKGERGDLQSRFANVSATAEQLSKQLETEAVSKRQYKDKLAQLQTGLQDAAARAKRSAESVQQDYTAEFRTAVYRIVNSTGPQPMFIIERLGLQSANPIGMQVLREVRGASATIEPGSTGLRESRPSTDPDVARETGELGC